MEISAKELLISDKIFDIFTIGGSDNRGIYVLLSVRYPALFS